MKTLLLPSHFSSTPVYGCLALLAILFAVRPVGTASAQGFTPPGETESFARYGIHYDLVQQYPGDRWTFLMYNDRGANVIQLRSLTPLIIFGLLGGSGGFEADNQVDIRSASNARYAPGFIEGRYGRTFYTTPFGELGAGVDAGFVILQKSLTSTENAFAAMAGPHLLYTARPIENLHVVAQLGYQFLGLDDELDSGRTVFDVEAYYPLNNWLAVYGSLHRSSWKATNPAPGSDESVKYSANGFSLGLSLVPTWQ
ncbi:MAG: hypothetical protein RhofKO_06550 [Rhodothermales bacterium]